MLKFNVHFTIDSTDSPANQGTWAYIYLHQMGEFQNVTEILTGSTVGEAETKIESKKFAITHRSGSPYPFRVYGGEIKLPDNLPMGTKFKFYFQVFGGLRMAFIPIDPKTNLVDLSNETYYGGSSSWDSRRLVEITYELYVGQGGVCDMRRNNIPVRYCEPSELKYLNLPFFVSTQMVNIAQSSQSSENKKEVKIEKTNEKGEEQEIKKDDKLVSLGAEYKF